MGQPCPRWSDPEATERVLRRRVRRPYHRVGTPPARATGLQGAPVALAHMAKLRCELAFHRYCLDKSPSSHALRDRGDAPPDVVQFRASVFVSLLPFSTAWMAARCRPLAFR